MKSLRDAILGQFEPTLVPHILEFSKALSTLRVDALMFMARKSLCLFDVLHRIGMPHPEAAILSDRVLDCDLAPLMGKRVAIVDDTLILGTTLAKAKRTLDAAGAQTTVHVFCVNTDWWSQDLLAVDSVGVALPDGAVMAFCAAEVRALSLLPRPYLVDFPISTPIRLSAEALDALFGDPRWRVHHVGTALQAREGVGAYSVFPSDALRALWSRTVPDDIFDCIELAKLRLFTRSHEGIHWTLAVPVVTLRPLADTSVERLFQDVLTAIGSEAPDAAAALAKGVSSPRAKQRTLQTLLSCSFGTLILRAAGLAEPTWDTKEWQRHYGPWLADAVAALGASADATLTSLGNPQRLPVQVAPLPPSVEARSSETLSLYSQHYPSVSSDHLSFLPTLTELFLTLFDAYELPSRTEVKRLGRQVLDADPISAPYLDRLETGLPWESIVGGVSQRLQHLAGPGSADLYSLGLDLCNDLGIAVPITAYRDGVVFRAYRHGEDVRFADAELSLAFDLVKGFLSTSGREDVPRLTLEKLLVGMIEVGFATGFLEPYYGVSGTTGVARIEFNLQGAVSVISADRHAGSDPWLSRYLQRRRVLVLNDQGHYVLGVKPDGHYRRSDSQAKAYEVGALVGKVLSRRSNDGRPLDQDGLALLVTCPTPRHTVGALRAELDIFARWLTDILFVQYRGTDWSDASTIGAFLKCIVASHGGHEAVHSAGPKYVAYRRGLPRVLVQNCSKFLADQNELDGLRWNGYWTALSDLQPLDERGRLDPLIDRLEVLCWEGVSGLAMLELACTQALNTVGSAGQRSIDRVKRKALAHRDLLKPTGLAPSSLVTTALAAFDAPVPDARLIARDAIDALEELIPATESVLAAADVAVDSFGRIGGKHDYSYMLYYDVVDSTATRAPRAGASAVDHRAAVLRFKQGVNDGLARLADLARKGDASVYCWNGDLASSNDCKHVFFSGKFAARFLVQTISLLVEVASASRGVRARIYAVPCKFAGTFAYRLFSDTEVRGDRFWEHFSRILKRGKLIEEELEAGGVGSMLFVLTDELRSALRLDGRLQWIEPKRLVVESEVAYLLRNTSVHYGTIRLS